MSKKNESLYDKRIVERNIRRSAITRKDYETYISKLPDVRDKAVRVFGEDDRTPHPRP